MSNSKQVYPNKTNTDDCIVYQSMEIIDRPFSGNRPRSERRHHNERVRHNRLDSIKNENLQDPEELNPRWVAGLDSHSLGCSCRVCRARSKQNKHKRTRIPMEALEDGY